MRYVQSVLHNKYESNQNNSVDYHYRIISNLTYYMKLLAINCTPNLSYFSERGLSFDVEYKTITDTFPLKFLYQVKDADGSMVDMYTPDVKAYMEANFSTKDYAIILYGWKPEAYGEQVKHTGGYTEPTPLLNGCMWATVRQDTIPNNNYALHELHHILCRILYTKGVYPVDFMDTDKKGRAYYLNDFPENPESNYAQTWNEIKKYLPLLNKKVMKTVTITRGIDTGKQMQGKLTTDGFSCDTLERPWKNNQPNISCIPKGTYNVKWTFSPRFMRYTYEVQKVPNRVGVRFHKGNYFFDVEGCILLGKGYTDLNKDGQQDIINSTVTIKAFETFMGRKEFLLVIK